MADKTVIVSLPDERELFLNALEKPEHERAQFLRAACGQDAGLRQRVESLLAEQADLGDFLVTPALAGNSASEARRSPGGTEFTATITEQPGDPIGRYKLLQKIGEGGCGVVYMAEQQEPVRRRVALKIIKLGMDTKSVIARFEAERQALAMMDHPNIAKVLDAGATDAGRPYFVMELVRGIRITEYCDQNNLSTEDRLKLFVQVAFAIQHAHQKGIIHRDIKPSNLLVTLHDGVPVPKVIDFGIAKATEQRLTARTLFTEFTAFIGTPAYMSPEQAEMSGLDIDTRSDIYSLGVLLYELLIGRTPFDAETLMRASLDECRRTIREQEPVRPSTRLASMVVEDLTTTASQRRTEAPRLIHLLRGDLDWIAMKCLEKDRTRRYATAHDLAADLQRYLDGEPVLARPPSSVYRFRKFVRRRRGAFVATALVAATLLMGAAVSAWLAVRATKAEHRALTAKGHEAELRQQAEMERERALEKGRLAQLNEYVADINLAQQSLAAGNFGRAVQLLEKHQPSPGETDLRGFEWRYLWQISQGSEHATLPSQGGYIQSVAFSPGNDLIALGQPEKFSLWDVRTKSMVKTVPKGAVSMAFFPDGKGLITASPATVRIWNTSDWTERRALPENFGPIVLSKDATRLATVSREGVRVWDTSTWKNLRVLPGASGPMDFSPDHLTLATETKEGITLWSLDDSRAEITLRDSTNVFARGGPWFRNERSMAFSPDGKSLVAARNTLSDRGVFVLSIWDTFTGEEIAVMPDDPEHIEHTGVISSLVFSPDGRTLATGSMDHSIRLWDFPARQLIKTLQGHVHEVWAIGFSADGENLVSGARDGGVKVWPTRHQEKEDVLVGARLPLAFSRNSRTLAALNREGTVLFWNVSTGEPEQQIRLERTRPRFGAAVALSDDLGTMVQALDNGTVRVWNTEASDFITLKAASGYIEQLALAPNGQTLITGSRHQGLRWWDLPQGTNTALATDANRILFAPDSRSFAAFGRGSTVQIWNATTRSVQTNLVVEPPPSFAAAFSPDGQMLAIVCQDDAIRLFNVKTGVLLGACIGHKQGVFTVAFSPNGQTLATASDDSTLKLWNVATQQELLNIRRLGGGLRALLFSPDGRFLASGSGSPTGAEAVRLYRAPVLSEIRPVVNNQ